MKLKLYFWYKILVQDLPTEQKHGRQKANVRLFINWGIAYKFFAQIDPD